MISISPFSSTIANDTDIRISLKIHLSVLSFLFSGKSPGVCVVSQMTCTLTILVGNARVPPHNPVPACKTRDSSYQRWLPHTLANMGVFPIILTFAYLILKHDSLLIFFWHFFLETIKKLNIFSYMYWPPVFLPL